MSISTSSIEQLSIDTIRTLSMDAVQKANSGHPGTPMALAPVAYTLFQKHLRYDPTDPNWAGRDRFILSCGHASMLLYSMLHLTGVKAVDDAGQVLDEPSITLDNIRNFRQLHSPCAGHPEYGEAAGIETTTGPLGQGCGNSIGMAAAARWLSATYDQPGYDLFGFDVYALCSDGDLMEGVACEAASLAGHLKLSNLCWIYDDNQITIEGRTELAFSEDAATRFEGLGWNAITVDDANDVEALDAAIEQFKATKDQPTIIIVKSIIGYPAPNKKDTSGAHGSALGEDEVRATKEVMGWNPEEHFAVPEGVQEHFANGLGARGQQLRSEWEAKLAEYEGKHADLAAQWKQMQSGNLPADWESHLPTFETDAKGMASRASSGKVINAIGPHIPWFIGGSADLAPSTNTIQKDEAAGHFGAGNYAGRNFHFGIREHAMASMCNGMSLAGVRPYAATFFVFSDYLRPCMRLASLMHQPVMYVFTHDSIGVGEDGPTHQPVEHLAAARSIPGLYVFRPGDANEVAQSYRAALGITKNPSALVLTRQALPTLDREKYGAAEGTLRGGYTVLDAPSGTPDCIVMATGSELSVAVAAAEQLQADGIQARAVSIPCWELFDEQDAAYRESVLPESAKIRVACEAGIRQGWDKYIGPAGIFVGMSSFGASAPGKELFAHFGITTENVVAQAKAALAG